MLALIFKKTITQTFLVTFIFATFSQVYADPTGEEATNQACHVVVPDSENVDLKGQKPDLPEDLKVAHEFVMQQIGNETMNPDWDKDSMKPPRKIKFNGVEMTFAQLDDSGERAAGFLSVCPFDGTISPLLVNPHTKAMQCQGCGSHIGIGTKGHVPHNHHYIIKAPQKVAAGHNYALPIATLSAQMKQIYFDSNGESLWVCGNDGCGNIVNLVSMDSCSGCGSSIDDLNQDARAAIDSLQGVGYAAVDFRTYGVLDPSPTMLQAMENQEWTSFDFHAEAKKIHAAAIAKQEVGLIGTLGTATTRARQAVQNQSAQAAVVIRTANDNRRTIVKYTIGAAAALAMTTGATIYSYNTSLQPESVYGEVIEVSRTDIGGGKTQLYTKVEFTADGESGVRSFILNAAESDRLSEGDKVQIKEANNGRYELEFIDKN